MNDTSDRLPLDIAYLVGHLCCLPEGFILVHFQLVLNHGHHLPRMQAEQFNLRRKMQKKKNILIIPCL